MNFLKNWKTMATGYTYKVAEGKITEFTDYALIIARAFGPFIHQREDSMDAELRWPDLDMLHFKELRKANKELEKFYRTSDDEFERLRDLDFKSRKKSDAAYTKETDLKLSRYNAMLKKVKQWKAPSNEHIKFKEFMISQLEDSIKFDTPFSSKPSDPEEDTLDKFKLDILRRIKWDINYHTKEARASYDRYVYNIDWIHKLYESLNIKMQPPAIPSYESLLA